MYGSLAVSGSNLFVALMADNGSIGEYNVDTGAAINASLISGSGPVDYIAVVGSAVPEPSTYAAILGLASMGFVMIRRRLVGSKRSI